MPKVPARESTPLTFDLKEDLLKKLELMQRRLKVASKSVIIRHALEVFDYGSFEPASKAHRQLSVRLPEKQKATLLRAARRKRVSVGELLRVALEQLPANPAGLEKQTTTEIVDMKKATKKRAPARKAAKKAAKKKAARKAPAKKTAATKKAAKKAPARKAAKKKTATKAPAKKKAAKKKAKKK